MVTSKPVDEIRGRDHSNEFPFLSVLNSGSDRLRKGICIGVAPPQSQIRCDPPGCQDTFDMQDNLANTVDINHSQ